MSSSIYAPLTVRRVFRLDGIFVCSICRSKYDNFGEADRCLHQCWKKMIEASGVSVRRNPYTLCYLYRCNFCGRDYEHDAKAKECVKACRGYRDEDITMEKMLFDSIGPLAINSMMGVKRIVKKPSTAKMAVTYRRPQWKKGTLGGVDAATDALLIHKGKEVQQDTVINGTKTAATPEPSVEDVETNDGQDKSSDKNKRKISMFGEGWTRTGAKYSCRVCNKEHFTKVEVLSCFQSHFDANGVEKD